MRRSVALAYYNGGQYIEEQVISILSQLGDEDELIISVDDAEEDGSAPILHHLKRQDRRVRVIQGPGKGVVRNFENAIRHCRGDIIFLSDQDDVWLPGKAQRVTAVFLRPEVMAVLHDARIVDAQGNPEGDETLFAMRKSGTGLMKNLVRNSYIGCCMAFRRELVPVILPIPERMYMHDYWIGTAAELCGEVALIREPLLAYRRHGGNVTELTHGSIGFMIRKRMDILRCLGILRRRVRRRRRQAALPQPERNSTSKVQSETDEALKAQREMDSVLKTQR